MVGSKGTSGTLKFKFCWEFGWRLMQSIQNPIKYKRSCISLGLPWKILGVRNFPNIFTLIHLVLPIMHVTITTTGTKALLLVTPSVPAKIAAKITQKQESITIWLWATYVETGVGVSNFSKLKSCVQ